MQIYFAGPLFTPYVRRFIEEHAAILRANGIEPFVPHLSFNPELSPARLQPLVDRGLLTAADLESPTLRDTVRNLLWSGRATREEVGFPPRSPEHIFDVDYDGLNGSNAVLALLDGTQVDDGTACEIGIFYGLTRVDPKKKGVIGWMTDSRSINKRDKGYGMNFFVLGVIEECGRVVHSFDDVLAQLKAWEAELSEGR